MPDGQDGIGNLRSVRLFNGPADRELRKLAPLLEARQYRPGQFIFQVGKKADYLYFLTRGTVKISLTSPAGEESLLRCAQGWRDVWGTILRQEPTPGRCRAGSDRRGRAAHHGRGLQGPDADLARPVPQLHPSPRRSAAAYPHASDSLVARRIGPSPAGHAAGSGGTVCPAGR